MPSPAKDPRPRLWADLEREIARVGAKKDKRFFLRGTWKTFVRKSGGFKVYAVDGTWIRRNLCVYFGHGGHGLVHEFIPLNEIWVSTHHYADGVTEITRCICKRRSPRQKASQACFDSTVLHEIEEHRLMRRGMAYWPAHKKAEEKERAAGLLADPWDDR